MHFIKEWIQIISIDKSRLTNIHHIIDRRHSFIRSKLFLMVYLYMPLEIVFVFKTLHTQLTQIGPLARVRLHVSQKMGGPVEILATHLQI